MDLNVMEIQRFAVHDGPGIRTLVFLKGCAMHCPWCSNPESQSPNRQLLYDAAKCIGCGRCAGVCPVPGAITLNGQGRPVFDRHLCTTCGLCGEVCLQNAIDFSGSRMTAEEIARLVLRDRDYYDQSGGGVTFSGGEALLQGEALLPLLRLLKEEGLHVAVETCGQFPAHLLPPLLPCIDLFLFDVKHVDPALLHSVTGGDAALIDANLSAILAAGRPVVARVPVIPGFNHSPEAMEAIFAYCAAKGITELHLLPYHTLGKGKYARLGRPYTLTAPMLTKGDLRHYPAQAAKWGIDAVIGGR